jgi:hypothetical protein
MTSQKMSQAISEGGLGVVMDASRAAKQPRNDLNWRF